MPELDLNYFSSLLQREKELLLSTDEGMGISLRESIQELSLIDNHPADTGSELFERSKDLSLHEKRLSTLKEIDDALRRIELGEYGICVRCGRQIEKERLEAIPYTPYCFACRQVREREAEIKESSDRPVEELNLSPPFKRTFLEDNSWYDGQNAWEQVAEYGTASSLQDQLPDYKGDLERGEGDEENAEVRRKKRKKPLL
ncbi:MAG: hypothetical protein GXZ07_00490 [Firmicutes bacterium]|nr:hypothetical protein [Bacillota bacterium]